MEPWEFFVGIVGFFLIVDTFDVLKKKRKRDRRTARVWGKVVDHETRTSSMGMAPSTTRMRVKYGIIAYTVSGKKYFIPASSGATWEIHRAGTELEVAYDPIDPENAAQVDGPIIGMIWEILPYLMPFLGIGCLVFLALYRLLS